MTKTDSLILKGVAILLMLYLHLFNQMQNVNTCANFLYIDDLPFVFILSRATNPVPFFLILSGYGLYTVRKNNPQYNIVKKMRNLYIHYWITLAIFVPLGTLVVGYARYPESMAAIINNVTAWNTTWNGEIWFFFPYILLALSSKVIFKVMDNVHPLLYFATTLLISLCMGFCISRYGTTYLYTHHLYYMPVLFFSLLFTFSLGAGLAKFNITERVKIGGGYFTHITATTCNTEVLFQHQCISQLLCSRLHTLVFETEQTLLVG